ncbi:MAG TPA: hypothetical protein ENN55_05950 [Firmicutes bacterium]|nr:hypothetical protein [Bacillota bacterium]
MTGRTKGFCAGYNAPGYANSGFGRGRGFGVNDMPFYAPESGNTERPGSVQGSRDLSMKIEMLEKELAAIREMAEKNGK